MVGGRTVFEQFAAEIRSDSSVYDHIDWTGFTEDEKNKWLADYRKLHDASTHLLKAHDSPYFLDRLKAIMEGLSILPDNPALLYARAQAEDKLLGAGRRLILDERSPDAIGLSRSISQVYAKSGIPWLITSEVLQRQGDMQQALFCAQQAVKAAPQNVEARRNLGALLTGLGKFDEALTEYQQMFLHAQKDRAFNTFKKAQMLAVLANSHANAKQFSQAIETAEEAIELASATGQKQLAANIEKNLASFKTDQAAQPSP